MADDNAPKDDGKPKDTTAPDTPEEKKVLGVALGDLMKIVLGAVIAVPITLLIGWYNSKEPHLTVSTQDTVQFRGDKGQFGLFNYSVKSDGSKEAEAVECSFKSDGATVQEVKVVPDTLNATTTIKDGKITVTVPMLNPGESVHVSAGLKELGSFPDRQEVTVRGKGVVGEKEPPKRQGSSWVVTGVTWFQSLVMGMLVVHLLNQRKEIAGLRKDKRENNARWAELARFTDEQNTRLDADRAKREAEKKAWEARLKEQDREHAERLNLIRSSSPEPQSGEGESRIEV